MECVSESGVGNEKVGNASEHASCLRKTVSLFWCHTEVCKGTAAECYKYTSKGTKVHPSIQVYDKNPMKHHWFIQSSIVSQFNLSSNKKRLNKKVKETDPLTFCKTRGRLSLSTTTWQKYLSVTTWQSFVPQKYTQNSKIKGKTHLNLWTTTLAKRNTGSKCWNGR